MLVFTYTPTFKSNQIYTIKKPCVISQKNLSCSYPDSEYEELSLRELVGPLGSESDPQIRYRNPELNYRNKTEASHQCVTEMYNLIMSKKKKPQ